MSLPAWGTMTYVAAPEIPDVLASRYASPEMTSLWSPAYKVILERRLWIAVLQAQQDLGVDVPAHAVVGLRSGRRRRRPRQHPQPGAPHPTRREGTHRGVQRAGRPTAGPQGHDQPGPDRERRAAAGEGLARHRSGQGCGCPGAAGAHRQRASRSGDDRSLSQRGGTGHDPRQAVRQRCGGAPDGSRSARGPDRALPAPRHQGAGRHLTGHARRPRRQHRASSPSSRVG